MRVLYIDEAGCLGTLPSSTSDIQPVFVIIGVTFDIEYLGNLTRDFVSLKRKFFPKLCKSQYSLDGILAEIKGSEIRKDAASTRKQSRRAAFRFLDDIFSMILQYNGHIFGRVWIKGIGEQFNGRSVYTFSMQDSCSTFQKYLESENDTGFIISDSRDKAANSNVSHSIFTTKFHPQGDRIPNLLEMPTFGHSDNHAGLQIADLICSAVVFPLAIETYCKNSITSVHTRDYTQLKEKFRHRLKSLQFRYRDMQANRWCGGITVSDHIGKKSGAELFR